MPPRTSRQACQGPELISYNTRLFRKEEIQRFLGRYGPEAVAIRDATPVPLFGVERPG